jgi:tetratricopeptide (TPR) repeat protein
VGVATENLSAYEKFLQGRNMFHGRAKLTDISGSIALLEAAVAEDPNFAAAWQWLAAAYSVSMGWGLHQEIPRDYPTLAVNAASRALDLDPTLSFATAIRGFATIIRPGGDYVFAMEQLEKSLEMDPRDVTVTHWYAIVLRELGFLNAAKEYFNLCEVLDPAFQNCKEHVARNLMFLGDYQGALKEWGSLDGEMVRTLPYELFDAYSLAKVGQTYAARLTLTQSFQAHPDFPATSWVSVISGERGQNSPEARKVEDWLDNSDREEIMRNSSQGADLFMFFYITIGAYEKIDPTNLSPGPGNTKGLWMHNVGDFRKTQQFKDVAKNMNFLPYWQARGFPPGCRAVGEEDFACE